MHDDMANTNLTVRKGQCINFGNCSKANAKEVIEVNLGDDFICPECEGSLIEVTPQSSSHFKWILVIVGILAVLGVGSFSVYKFVYPIQKEYRIELDKTSFEFANTGASEQLTATIYLNNKPEKNKKVIWQSNESTIATVDSTGLVTAIAKGKANITVTTPDGSQTASCTIIVNNNVDIRLSGLDPTIRYSNSSEIVTSSNEHLRVEAGDFFIGVVDKNGNPENGKLYNKDGRQKHIILPKSDH